MIASHPNVNLVFHALGDPTRRTIVERLSKRGPLAASDLAEPLGITLTAVTQHLRVLEDCRLVHTEKIGRTRHCRVDSAGFSAVSRWIENQRASWEKRLDRLGAILEEDNE